MTYVLDPSGRTLHWVMLLEKDPNMTTGSLIPVKRPMLVNSDLALDIIRVSANKTQFTGDRPYFSHHSIFLELTDRIHDWLAELQYPYQVDWRWQEMRVGVHVGFLDKGHAAHFKLTWG